MGQESGVNSDAGVNVAMVPLGTPILAGPGAIVATMLAVREANGIGGFLAVTVGLFSAIFIVWLFLRFAGQVHRVLKDSGTMLVTRIAGLLLSAIAVQMIANSVRAFVATGS
jgi:multiple antibiotic resistance protein